MNARAHVSVALTRQALWEAAAKLMDAKEQQRGGRRAGEAGQVGDKCPYCSVDGAKVNQCQWDGGRKKENKASTVGMFTIK